MVGHHSSTLMEWARGNFAVEAFVETCARGRVRDWFEASTRRMSQKAASRGGWGLCIAILQHSQTGIET